MPNGTGKTIAKALKGSPGLIYEGHKIFTADDPNKQALSTGASILAGMAVGFGLSFTTLTAGTIAITATAVGMGASFISDEIYDYINDDRIERCPIDNIDLK